MWPRLAQLSYRNLLNMDSWGRGPAVFFPGAPLDRPLLFQAVFLERQERRGRLRSYLREPIPSRDWPHCLRQLSTYAVHRWPRGRVKSYDSALEFQLSILQLLQAEKRSIEAARRQEQATTGDVNSRPPRGGDRTV